MWVFQPIVTTSKKARRSLSDASDPKHVRRDSDFKVNQKGFVEKNWSEFFDFLV